MKLNEFPELKLTDLSDNDLLLGYSAAEKKVGILKLSTLKSLLGGSAALWNPEKIATSLWMDASDSDVVIQASNVVSQWSDKSGNNRHLYQTENSRKPTLVNGLNGKNFISFDGANDYLRAASNYNFGSNLNMFFVVKYNNSSRAGVFDSAPNQAQVLRNLNNTFEWWDNNPTLTIDCTVGEFEILNVSYQLAPNRIVSKYINGSRFATASSGSTGDAAWGQLTIGSVNTSDYLFNGSVAEIIFTTSFSSLNRQKIEGYLAWKWGLNSKLTDDHPYKSSAPTT